MNEQELKSMGFKDMNPMQIDALRKVMAHALNLADAYSSEAFEEVFEDIEEMVLLFGGEGLTVEVKPSFGF
jgi:hypothetical protein